MSGAPSRPSSYQKIYAVVRKIPAGRVATYGQIAELAGLPRAARQVGYALHALDDESGIPWQRVVNSRGEVSQRQEWGADQIQRQLLEAEGLEFDGRGRIDLKRYRWQSRSKRNSSKRLKLSS